MRIAILTHGGNLFAETYATGFRDRGHQVLLLSLDDPPLELEGIACVRVGPRGYRPTQSSARVLPYLRAVLPTRRALERFEPDLLFALYLSSAGVVARLTGFPRVVHSALGNDAYDRVDSRSWRALFHWMLASAPLVHTVSEHLRALLMSRWGVPPQKIVLAPLGVVAEDLPAIDPEARPGEGRLLVTRRHEPLYDQETVVKALALLRDGGSPARLTFACGGSFLERTQGFVAKAGLNERVRFLPGYDQAGLPGLLAAHDLYVSASLNDGTSTSLLEALCTQTPVVVSDIPANRPWVGQEAAGLLFPPGDAAALARGVSRLLADSALRQRMGATGRAAVLERGERDVGLDRLAEAFATLR